MDRSDESDCDDNATARAKWGRPDDNSVEILFSDDDELDFSEPLCTSLANADLAEIHKETQDCVFGTEGYHSTYSGIRLGESMPCVVITDFCRVSFSSQCCVQDVDSLH